MSLRRRDGGRDGASRQCDRGQHVHAGLCLSDRPRAALRRSHREGDRAQRRSGEDEPLRLHLGPPRCCRARAVARHDERAEGADATRAAVRDAATKWSSGASRSSPTIRTRATGGATAGSSSACARRKRKRRAGLDRAHRCGRALAVQAHGLQGRVRGGASLHERPFRETGAHRPSRARTCVTSSTWRRRSSPRRILSRAAAQDELRAVDDEGVARAGEVQEAARHAARRVRLHP